MPAVQAHAAGSLPDHDANVDRPAHAQASLLDHTAKFDRLA